MLSCSSNRLAKKEEKYFLQTAIINHYFAYMKWMKSGRQSMDLTINQSYTYRKTKGISHLDQMPTYKSEVLAPTSYDIKHQ